MGLRQARTLQQHPMHKSGTKELEPCVPTGTAISSSPWFRARSHCTPPAQDRYEEALLAHLKAKQVGTVQERNPTFATPRRVINLMDALRRSVSEDKRQPRRAGEPRALQRANRRECHAAMPTAGRPPSAASPASIGPARPNDPFLTPHGFSAA